MNANTPNHTAGFHELNCDCHYCQHLKHCALVHVELLEALKNLIACADCMAPELPGAIEYARETIAKAEGRS